MLRPEVRTVPWKAAMASSLVALIMLLGLASSNEDIHHLIHGHEHDQQVDFQCAVSLFKKGSLECAQTSVPVQSVTFLGHAFAQNDTTIVCRIDRLLPPICGPPSLLS